MYYFILILSDQKHGFKSFGKKTLFTRQKLIINKCVNECPDDLITEVAGNSDKDFSFKGSTESLANSDDSNISKFNNIYQKDAFLIFR